MEYRYAKRYPVPGLLNCRELGGYPLPGGQTRWGLFWRSACPCGLSEEAVAALERMGLALVIDLRSGFERRQQPSALAGRTAFSLLELPLLDQIGASMTHTNDMGEFYAALLHHGQACFRTLFTRIAEVEGPVLFHCTAGKDRTGVAAMLLLKALGADAESAVYVGDSGVDGQPAKNAGLPFIWVSWGFRKAAEMPELPETRAVDAAQLESLLLF